MPRSSGSLIVRAGRIIVAALAIAFIPQQALAQPSAFRTPQFKATAVSFKALHETHWNWTGSDEVFGVFYDFAGTSIGGTSTFGDVDAGETRNIAPGQSCISIRPACDRGARDLGFGIALVEEDNWGFFSPGDFCHGALMGPAGPPPTPEDFERLFDNFSPLDCSKDELIGKAKVKLSEAELVAALPTVGASFDRTVALTGGDGRYEFTYRVTRLPNAINIPPIGPPVSVVAISLEAMPKSTGQIVLTWSGATTASVDIYLDASKLVTTANTGNYSTSPQPPGPHQVRVCELNSTAVCSADVQVAVP